MRSAFCAVTMLCGVVMGPGGAYAQSRDSSVIAEQLFTQALELAKANQWAEACPKFEASLKYEPVLGTRLNLAACYVHIGKLASAWGLYHESIDLARKADDARRRDQAQKQATALEARLPRLVITPPARSPAGLVVKRDGIAIEDGAFGVALYVDPGAHEITASAPGFETFTQAVTLAEGKTETIALPDLTERPMPAAAPSSATPPAVADLQPRSGTTVPPPGPGKRAPVAATERAAGTSSGQAQTEATASTAMTPPAVTDHETKSGLTVPPPSPGTLAAVAATGPVAGTSSGQPETEATEATEAPVASPGTRHQVAIGLGAVGVAAVGVGLFYGARARSSFNDAKALCGPDVVCDPARYEAGRRLTSEASSAATTSTGLVAAGGAAIVTGAIVLLTAPRARARATARLVPVAHDRGGGLALVGRF